MGESVVMIDGEHFRVAMDADEVKRERDGAYKRDGWLTLPVRSSTGGEPRDTAVLADAVTMISEAD